MRITNKEQLAAHGNREGRKIVAELLDAGLDALDPYVRVKQLVHVENGKIVLHTDGFEMKGDPHAGPLEFDLKDYDRVYVIGAAKGVQRAALAMEEALGDVLTGGHVIAKHGEDIICKKIGVTLAGHPVPDEACVEGCKKIEALARDITSRDLVFTITGSGCGSLMTYPADDITIDEIARFTHMMQIEKGVPTSDLNPIRTHIDRFKGGRLSRLFRPATLVHMTTADPSKQNTPVTRTTYFEMLEHNTFFPPLSTGTTYADCIAILQKWNAWDKTPVSIQNRLLRGTPETENMSVEEYESLGARFFGLIFKDATVYPAVRKCDALVMLCANYNDALAANLTACVNRLTALFRQTRMYDKRLFGLIVSGYSGGDLLARQLISALNMNKSFFLPPHFCLLETANERGSLIRLPGIARRAHEFAAQLSRS